MAFQAISPTKHHFLADHFAIVTIGASIHRRRLETGQGLASRNGGVTLDAFDPLAGLRVDFVMLMAELSSHRPNIRNKGRRALPRKDFVTSRTVRHRRLDG